MARRPCTSAGGRPWPREPSRGWGRGIRGLHCCWHRCCLAAVVPSCCVAAVVPPCCVAAPFPLCCLAAPLPARLAVHLLLLLVLALLLGHVWLCSCPEAAHAAQVALASRPAIMLWWGVTPGAAPWCRCLASLPQRRPGGRGAVLCRPWHRHRHRDGLRHRHGHRHGHRDWHRHRGGCGPWRGGSRTVSFCWRGVRRPAFVLAGCCCAAVWCGGGGGAQGLLQRPGQLPRFLRTEKSRSQSALWVNKTPTDTIACGMHHGSAPQSE